MTIPSPTPQVTERLRLLGEREVLTFLNEVTNKTDRELLKVLPSVDGFRKDSVAGLLRRKQVFVSSFLKKRATGSGNKARADNASYYYFWRAWAEQHLPDVEGLDALLGAIEKATTREHPQTVADQPQLEIEALFRCLQEQSFLNRCAAETIARLLRFSPFEITDTLDRLATGSKPSVAVEKDRALSTLPDRLQDDERLLKRLQGDVERQAKELVQLAEALAGLRTQPPQPVDNSVRFAELEAKFVELSTGVLQKLDVQGQAVERRSDEMALRMGAIESRIADLEALWGDTEKRLDKLAEDFGQELASLSDIRAKAMSHPDSAPMATGSQVVTSSSTLHIVPLRLRPEAVKPLATGVEAVRLLTSNFVALGLKSSSAITFAEELLAAVVTGRVLFLKGAYAADLARATAMALAGQHSFRARVPVGFVDASTLDEDAQRVFVGLGDAVGVLVLERVNNAPFELLVDAVAELVRTAGVLVVATLSDGVSTLPEQPLYLQLGPVFDTDVLDWNVFLKSAAPIVAGALASLDPEKLSMRLSSGKPQTEELVRLLRRDRSFRNPRIERATAAYMAALESFRTTNVPTSLQSTAYAWLWPLWRMIGFAMEDCEQELDGGKVDSDGHVDGRLKLLLELAGPDKG